MARPRYYTPAGGSGSRRTAIDIDQYSVTKS
jgi:hypothetical protein